MCCNFTLLHIFLIYTLNVCTPNKSYIYMLIYRLFKMAPTLGGQHCMRWGLSRSCSFESSAAVSCFCNCLSYQKLLYKHQYVHLTGSEILTTFWRWSKQKKNHTDMTLKTTSFSNNFVAIILCSLEKTSIPKKWSYMWVKPILWKY